MRQRQGRKIIWLALRGTLGQGAWRSCPLPLIAATTRVRADAAVVGGQAFRFHKGLTSMPSELRAQQMFLSCRGTPLLCLPSGMTPKFAWVDHKTAAAKCPPVGRTLKHHGGSAATLIARSPAPGWNTRGYVCSTADSVTWRRRHPWADGNCSTQDDVSERGTTNGQTSEFGGTRTPGGIHATW